MGTVYEHQQIVYTKFGFWNQQESPQAEHQQIRERRADPDSEVTWEEYKSMKFTSHVSWNKLEHPLPFAIYECIIIMK